LWRWKLLVLGSEQLVGNRANTGSTLGALSSVFPRQLFSTREVAQGSC